MTTWMMMINHQLDFYNNNILCYRLGYLQLCLIIIISVDLVIGNKRFQNDDLSIRS